MFVSGYSATPRMKAKYEDAGGPVQVISVFKVSHNFRAGATILATDAKHERRTFRDPKPKDNRSKILQHANQDIRCWGQ
ncbi:hypothetical protein MTO96_005167 [Rhipicephalus appendiculatus]